MNSTEPLPVSNPSSSSTEPVHILCGADTGYAPQLCTMLVSLLAHHPRGRGIEIYILATKMPDVDRQKIEGCLTSKFPHFQRNCLHWLAPSQDALEGLHVNMHINLEVYSRLLAPTVLPAELDRILYLDADLIVVGDLCPLYDMPFEGNAVVAACEVEVATVSGPGGVFNYASLGIPADNPYFNSGVLLMDLRRWREEKIPDKIFNYLRTYGKQVYFWDQGGMNAILYNQWRQIHPLWNQQRIILFPESWVSKGFKLEDWKRAKNHPKVIHFTGPAKPWLPGMRRPGYSYFFRYFEQTPYRNLYHSPLAERILGYNLYFAIWHFFRKFYVLFKKEKGAKAKSP